MTPAGGRRPGLMINAEAFENFIGLQDIRKSQAATAAGFTPTFLADVLAHRGGIDRDKANNLAAAIGVRTSSLFPELCGFTYTDPIVRKAKRVRT